MINEGPRLLVVDDEPDICRALEFFLSREGFSVTTATNAGRALDLMAKRGFDLLLTDLKMDGMDGMALLERTKELHPSTIVIIMTAYATVESAVNAMKKGAADYILKPFVNEDVKQSIMRLLDHRRLEAENRALRHQLSHLAGKDFIGQSAKIKDVFRTLEKVVATKSNIFLLGESGTGKGRIAEIIHYHSPRGQHHFVGINCSAIPETLLESELFGYKKGAFTGADQDKPGLIATADRGTLFLDEIGDMPLGLQSKLLKVLEAGDLIPLGSTERVSVDLRVIAATNRDIENEIKRGAFREDLYYRLNVIELTIPPLRERKEDIPLLAEYFIEKYSWEHNKDVRKLDAEALAVLLEHPWPGNVRELGNVLERAVLLCSSGAITAEDLPAKLRRREGINEAGGTLRETLGYFERQTIIERIAHYGGDKEAAARDLGIDLATLYRKMKKLGISIKG